ARDGLFAGSFFRGANPRTGLPLFCPRFPGRNRGEDLAAISRRDRRRAIANQRMGRSCTIGLNGEVPVNRTGFFATERRPSAYTPAPYIRCRVRIGSANLTP